MSKILERLLKISEILEAKAQGTYGYEKKVKPVPVYTWAPDRGLQATLKTGLFADDEGGLVWSSSDLALIRKTATAIKQPVIRIDPEAFASITYEVGPGWDDDTPAKVGETRIYWLGDISPKFLSVVK